MRLTKVIRLIWTFYKSFLLLSAVVTAGCVYLFRKYGLVSFTGLFWCKAITLALTYYFINSYNKNEYYYYLNLGVSKRLLWVATLSFDFILFLFLLSQAYHTR